MVVVVSLLFISIGLYIAVMLSIDSMQKILEMLVYPLFMILVLALFCALGQNLRDSVCFNLKIILLRFSYLRVVHCRQMSCDMVFTIVIGTRHQCRFVSSC